MRAFRVQFLFLVVFAIGMMQSDFCLASSKKQKCHVAKKKHQHHSRSTSTCQCTSELQVIENSINQINQTTTQDLAIDKEILGIVSAPACFTIIEELPFVISAPGYYKLCSDLAFEPPASGTLQTKAGEILLTPEVLERIKEISKQHKNFSGIHHDIAKEFPQFFEKSISTDPNAIAIDIQASNVVLDLNGHRLFQDNTNAGTGIELEPGVENITIRNGTISNFTQVAIHSFIGDSSPQTSSKTLLFENLNILDNGTDGAFINNFTATGITLDSPAAQQETTLRTDFKYYNVTISNCKVNNNISEAVFVNQADNLRILNSQLDNTYIHNAPFNVVLGLQAINSKNLQLLNSTFNDSTLFSGTGFVSGGALIVDCQSVQVNECQFNGLQSLGPSIFAVGVLGASCQDWLFENSQFSNLFGGPGTSALDGIHHSDSDFVTFTGGPLQFVNCQFNNIRHADGNFFGFGGAQATDIITNKDVVFESCQAGNITNVDKTLGLATGFAVGTFLSTNATTDVASARNITFRNCNVSNINNNTPVGLASGFELHLSSDGSQPSTGLTFRNVTCDNNVASNINSKSEAAFGIHLDNGEVQGFPMSIKNVILKNNVIADVHAKKKSAAGIFLKAVHNPVVANNIIDDVDTGILLTSDAVNVFTTNGVIKENVVSNCLVAGYQDDLVPTTSAWINNLAFNNGHPVTVNTNYAITFSGVPPIDAGTLSAYPAPGNKLYNTSLAP